MYTSILTEINILDLNMTSPGAQPFDLWRILSDREPLPPSATFSIGCGCSNKKTLVAQIEEVTDFSTLWEKNCGGG